MQNGEKQEGESGISRVITTDVVVSVESKQATDDFLQSLRSHIIISCPEHSGWLWRKRTSWTTSFSTPANRWRRCWFELKGFSLTYWNQLSRNSSSFRSGSNGGLSKSISSSALSALSSSPLSQLPPQSPSSSEPAVNSISLSKAQGPIDYSDEPNAHDGIDDESVQLSFCVHSKSDSLFRSADLTLVLRADSEEDKQQWMIKLAQAIAIATNFAEYSKMSIVGEGGQGKVYKIAHIESGELFAMKEIEIADEEKMKLAISEAQILKDVMTLVAHPNLMEIKKVYHIGNTFNLLFPLCEGGELIDRIRREKKFEEKVAARVLHDLISALHAMHKHNILHLDIKPENILYVTKDKNSPIKLTDFGLSRVCSASRTYDMIQQVTPGPAPTVEHMDALLENFIRRKTLSISQGVGGSIGYMSPELILSGYRSAAADVFAAGAVFYTMLCGSPPFEGPTKEIVITKTVCGDYQKYGTDWDTVTDGAKDLLYRMLEKDPTKRITTSEILAHPFFLS